MTADKTPDVGVRPVVEGERPDPADFGGAVMPPKDSDQQRVDALWSAFGCATRGRQMTVTTRQRGHLVFFDQDENCYRYADDNTLAPSHGGVERPCTKCGLTADSNYGPDPCLGYIPGLTGGACCGHGIDGAVSPEVLARVLEAREVLRRGSDG